MWLLLYLIVASAKSPSSAATSASHYQAIVSFAKDIPPLMKPSLTTANGTGLVRDMRATYDGIWASAPVRLGSREKPLDPFWPNRDRRELEELLEALYASAGSRQGQATLGDASWRPSRDAFPTPRDELRSMLRQTPQETGFFGSLLRNEVKLPKAPAQDYETATNRSYPDDDDDDDDEGFKATSDRGRRKASKEVPDLFLANRGRATDEEDQVEVNMVRGAADTETFFPNREREADDQDIFYPNKGREARDLGPFYPNMGTEIGDSDTFYPNKGMELDEQGPFYLNRGRNPKDEDFWPVGERELHATTNPFWPNRLRDADEVSYWTRRARSLDDDFSFESGDDPDNAVASALKQRVRIRDVLYAELPTWIPLESRRSGLASLASRDELFWTPRGRRTDADETRLRRGLKNSLTPGEMFQPARGRRGLRESLSADELFYPLRGKRGPKETLPAKEHFWTLRGRRDLGESLARDEMFMPLRGRRDGLKSLPKDELFYPLRGKKSDDHIWRGRRVPTESTVARALGNLQDPNFWPLRGKRPRETEDAAFWGALKERSAAKKELAASVAKEGGGN